MSLDYLSSNELNKYPFKDNSSLIATNSSTIKNTYFADLLITYKTADGNGANLNTIYNNTDDEEITITFSFLNGAGAFLIDGLTIPYSAIVAHDMFSYDGTLYSIKLVFGSEFEELKDFPAESNFGAGKADIAESAIVLMVPRVTSLAFYNVEVLEALFQGDELTSTDVLIQEGSNMSFTQETDKVVLSVIAGAGTGLYNPCSGDLVITSINETGPDVYNNFLLLTDGCYTTRKGTDDQFDFGITIENICTPRCTADQLGGFAHYLNRVKDGMHAVGILAGDIYTEMRDEIDTYTTDFLPTKNTPVIKSAVARFTNAYDDGYDYYSFVVSYINRSSEPVAITSTIGLTGATMMMDSIRYKQASDVELLGSANISKTLPCLQGSRLEFTVKSSSGTVTINAGAGTTSYTKVYTI